MHLPTLQRSGFQKLSDNLYRYYTDTFRTSPETVCFHWFTYKHKKHNEESDSDSETTLDDDDVANSDGVISESVSSLPQVGDMEVIRADDPVFFFYLIKVTQEETML